MDKRDNHLEALKTAQRGMFRSLGILEAISHLNDEAGLVALIEAGKQLLGNTLEDTENVIEVLTVGDAK